MSVAPELIRQARKHAGISQSELARRARMPQPVVNAYERGAREPSVESLDRLLRAVRLTLTLSPLAEPLQSPEHVRQIVEVFDLADALPQAHTRTLSFPKLPPVPPKRAGRSRPKRQSE